MEHLSNYGHLPSQLNSHCLQHWVYSISLLLLPSARLVRPELKPETLVYKASDLFTTPRRLLIRMVSISIGAKLQCEHLREVQVLPLFHLTVITDNGNCYVNQDR